ncbi:N,N-dimethylformamidase beta subunit family domain-containing protein [Thiocapsa bogorovii]|uniref:N,N-dimethylformamidase beta subunit family domain-containing protein n=1 Tax=Thiocapsa bogorovii TaxID=521689 RepID=UPI001E2B4708|nr:N,N-dimethylformamidase beta subunit family domain-containing protein [Thiocapsa bogorovii]UHD18619.1 hypothetical protein LT988_11550 [Thiocapsa bogorovii]
MLKRLFTAAPLLGLLAGAAWIPNASADAFIKADSAMEHAEFRGQWANNTHYSWFDLPSDDRSKLEVWGYTDATSYAPGDTVNLHVSTTADRYDLTVTRDGAAEEVVLEEKGLAGKLHPTPKDAYRVGPGWPVAHSIAIPETWKSGGYIVTFKVTGEEGQRIEQEAFFILRPKAPGQAAIAFVAATTTWQAYNDWGGSNYYEGVAGESRAHFSPELSTLRPWARGLIRVRGGAPRIVLTEEYPIGAAPRYPNLEYAYARGYSKYYAAAGWAMFDALFARWAERNGYTLDYYAQDDLGRNPDLLKQYKTVVVVGHDEYHTRDERTAIDDYIEAGGHLARFAGNLIWQARREGDTLICYKSRAATEDPVRDDPEKKDLLTSVWEAQAINWPPQQTWGVSGTRGIYMKLGGFQPRASGGFTVYRPKHWALEGTDLYYGDLLGAKSNIAGFEGDGVDYTFRYGLPYATGEDGAPKDLTIIAMALAGQEEEDHGNFDTYLYAGDADLAFTSAAIYGKDTPENRDKLRYGSGMMVNMRKGKGEVFSASTTDWVVGLQDRDPFVERITRNVLDRYSN